MMASLNVSDDLLSLLKVDAAAHGIAAEQRADDILRHALSKRAGRATVFAELSSIAAMTPKHVRQTDSVEMVRQDRQR